MIDAPILVVAVHPDDETLGCGGTLLRARALGHPVHWLLATKCDARREALARVQQAFGFASTHELAFAPGRLDQVPRIELVQALAAVIVQVRPRTLFLPFHADVHSDHRVAFAAAWSCTKSFRYPFVASVLMMETISETEFAPPLAANAFLPNAFVDISAHLERKLEILHLYEGEVGVHPFPRSDDGVRAQAALRGATAGCRYAEAFALLKAVVA